jgi:hypothetical protein
VKDSAIDLAGRGIAHSDLCSFQPIDGESCGRGAQKFKSNGSNVSPEK